MSTTTTKSKLKINYLTEEQYAAIPSAELDPTAIYITPNDNTTLADYKIADAYTKEEVNTTINAKPTILSGTTAPTADLGKDGDIYILYSV